MAKTGSHNLGRKIYFNRSTPLPPPPPPPKKKKKKKKKKNPVALVAVRSKADVSVDIVYSLFIVAPNVWVFVFGPCFVMPFLFLTFSL